MNRKGALAVLIALAVVVCLLIVFFAGGGNTSVDEAETDGGAVSDRLESGVEETESGQDAEPVGLTVFAAAATQKALTELGNSYMLNHENVTIVFNFDSSDTLSSQIRDGANCDILISDDPSQMDLLDAGADSAANPDGLDLVLEDTRRELIENKIALAVPAGNPAGITSYAGLAAALGSGSVSLATRSPGESVGMYAQEILDFYGLSAEDLSAAGSIVYGSTTKDTAALVSGGSADCGIFYQADAFSAGLTVVDTATAELCGQVIYSACVLNISQHEDAARDFLDYLSSSEAAVVFEKVGFTPKESR